MPALKQIANSVVQGTIRRARRWSSLRRMVDRAFIENLTPGPEFDGAWSELDRVYSLCRRRLHADPAWRYGPARVHEIAKEGFQAIQEFTSLEGKVFCDLGCGTFHPFGISAVMFLNGAGSTIALDLNDGNKQRAAESLADLLGDCCGQEKWNWADVDDVKFINKIQRFNIQALNQGRLTEGLADVPMSHVVTDIHNPILEEESIDVMTSRAVLEHFLDFDVAMKRLFQLMRKGGVIYHHIDLVDHRAYRSSDYHYWSFLAEGEDWSDGLVNRLRSSEIKRSVKEAGFEVLRYDNRVAQMPEGFIDQVAGRFRDMTKDDLSATGVFCVLRKP